MEMESSLNQLDEYLERIGSAENSFEIKTVKIVHEQEDESAAQEQGDEGVVQGQGSERVVQEQGSDRVVQEQGSERVMQGDDGRGEEEQSQEIEDINLQEKSIKSLTVIRTEKSINFKDNEESFEKSNTFTGDFTPQKHNSIDSYPEVCNSGDSVFGNGQVESDKDLNFGNGTSVFRITDSQSNFIENVKSESLHFEESEEVVNELAEIGLSEENLQNFALSGTTSSISQKVDSDSVTSNVQVHPVSLKKSTAFSEKSVVSKPPKGQVTTLLDLSSIGELKRLWAKSPKKKPGTRSTGKLANAKGFSHASSDEKEMKQSTQDVDETLFEVTSACNTEIGLERNRCEKEITNMSCHTKQCSVKLVRVEGLFMPENLKIDLSIPKTSAVSDDSSDCKKVSGSCKQKASNKNCDKINEGVKDLVANSLKRISAKSKSISVDLKTKHKKQVGPKAVAQKSQKNSTSVNDRPLQLKTETEETGMNEHSDPVNNIPYEWLNIGNEDSNYEQDDDFYIPSDDDDDDDYKPKKKKKKKSKRVHSIKREKVEIKDDDLSSQVSVRSSGKKRKGTRIGRPPVFGHFECKFCDFTANEKNLIDKHHFKCHRIVLTCQDCEKVFRSVNGLLEHQAYKHDGGKPFKCDHEGCDYASKNPTDLDRHKAKHETELKHVCDICGWRTKWRRNMRHHHTLKHCDERNYKCTICEFAAKRPYDLKEHMYRHSDEKPIQCLVCGFRVKTNYELRSHMLVHSNDKPFKCTFPGCSGATKTRADLTKHMRVHQTERPFKCHICFKSYKDQHALNKHISGIHVDQRRYKCDICGKYFKNKYALRKHMYLHAGHKPHECPVCQWKFSTRSNMEKHMVTHDTNERPYPCPLCPHAAKQPDHLLAHIGTVHGDKYAYFCELCNKPFKRYMQLKLHYERMHTEKEVKKLNSSTVDLALLKMEMTLELEERESGKNGKRKKRKSRSKSKTLSDVDIKQEPVDEEYRDVVNSEECNINDVRLDEDTGKIEIVKKKSKVGKPAYESKSHNADVEPDPDFTGDEEIDMHKDDKGVAVELPETLNSSTTDKSEVDQVAEGSKHGEHEENEIVLSDSDADNDIQVINGNNENNLTEEEKYDSEDLEKKKDSILIAKDGVSTVALYENFRLPLATKGFKFNYNKNGTKPMKAWFMDVSLMDRQTAEKHKKHRRRLGLLPPIPRGHPPKGYKRLQRFVDKRKKQLAVNIKKAKFVKDLGLVSKRNVSRAKRFPGKYTEFETVDGKALSVTQVRDRLPKLEYPIKKEKSVPLKQTAKKIPAAKKTHKHAANTRKSKVKSVTTEKHNKTAKTKETVKKETTKNSRNKKKVVTKKASPKSSKLLLSSEKKKPGRPKVASLKIRKPTFLDKGCEDISVAGTSNRNSFAALESILSEFSQSSSASVESESTNLDVTAGKQKRKYKANSKTKTKSVNVKKQKSKPSTKSNAKGQAKPKYNKKYVPVKQPMKRKNNLNEKRSYTKKFKPIDTSESSSVEQNIQGHAIYQPTNVHLPVQNSQFVMVYPAGVLQTDNLPESNESFFVTMNDNNSCISEGASQMERLDLRRNLNDMLTDSYTGGQEHASGNNASMESDKVLMQKEYTETVLVKEEPYTDMTYYTSLAQQSSV